MAISIFFPLVLIGAAAMVMLIVRAISKSRAGVALVLGAVAFLCLMVITFLALSFSYVTHSVDVPPQAAPAWAGGPINDAVRIAAQQFQSQVVFQGPTPQAVFGIAWAKLLILGVLACGIAFGVYRRMASPGGFGHHRVWPALLAVPVIALFLLVSVRYEVHQNVASTSAMQMQQMASERQAVLAQQKAKAEAEMQLRVAKSEAFDQIDNFDRPRIALPPVPISPAEAEVSPAVPATPAKQVAATKQSDEKKVADAGDKSQPKSEESGSTKSADSTHKRKKPAKISATGDAKTQAVAQSKPAEDHVKAIPGEHAPSKPAWTEESPRLTGPNPREVFPTDEYATTEECYQAADIYLLLKAYQYVQQFSGLPRIEAVRPTVTLNSNMILADGVVIAVGRENPRWVDSRFQTLNRMGIGIDFVREKLVAKDPRDHQPREFVETTNHSSVGPMKKLWLEIEFTPEVVEQLHQRWNARQREERFTMVGAGAGSVLGFLSLVFALLKIDTWTKGYYSKRLFLGVPLAIIGVLLLAGLLIGRPVRGESATAVPLPPGYSHSN